MGVILELKNAIRDTLYGADNTLNFNFNEIQTVDYPFIFFYIPSYKIDKAISNEYWRKVELMCVIEYGHSENNSTTQLWSYEDNLEKALEKISFHDNMLEVTNPEFKIVDDVLQMTFNLEFYVKEVEIEDLMLELDITLN